MPNALHSKATITPVQSMRIGIHFENHVGSQSIQSFDEGTTRSLITVWFLVRVQAGPPMRSSTWRKCRFCCGLFRGPVALFRLSLEAACTDHRSCLWTAALAERWRVSKMRSVTPRPTTDCTCFSPTIYCPATCCYTGRAIPIRFRKNFLRIT
jgi:hypothetical protein